MAKLDVKVPSVGESITEVTISSWLKGNGEQVDIDEPIAEIESDKATVELVAESAGVLSITVEEGETVEVGSIVATIDTDGSAAPAKAKEEPKQEAAPAQSAAPSSSGSHAQGHPSPAAGKILAEKGVDPSQVSGTGKDGRITKSDAMSASASSSAPQEKKEIAQQVPQSGGGARDIKREKMSGLRKTIAKRLVEAKNSTAMLTTFNEVDMHEIMALRSRYKDDFLKKHDVKLGFMSLFTKALTMACKNFPGVNAMIDGQEIVYHDYCDVGIAVSAPKGLVVPVVRNAESLSLAQIEKEILRLAGKARDGKLSLEEMQNGTITITNGGVFGSMLSTPILNIPQSAILGMHNIVERPVAVKGQVVVHPVMYLALSYDHRIVDGRESVGFLKTIKDLIEDPARMILDL